MYSVGNLHMALTGIDKSATTSIDRVITKLNQLNAALSVFSKANLSGFATLGTALSNFANVTSGLSFKNFNSFVTKLNKIDFAKAGAGFDSLATSIEPFLTKVMQAEKSLTALYGVLQKASTKKTAAMITGGGGSGNNSGAGRGYGGFASFFNISKIWTSIFLIRRMASIVGGIVQKGSEYTETLNLWQVAMRDNLDLADKFITKMNKAYGISEKTLMNAQAVFKNMIGSLGQISDQTAYLLSETLIQMSVDFASLYNTTLQQAFNKMKSMLAGQVRPIRSAGLDMTETTLYMFYQQLGGTKTMRQLNRTEKQLLSIYAVFKQMGEAGALGDMTKTLDNFANQSRITAEAWEEFATWFGVIIKYFLQESGLLLNVNSLLITMGEIMQAIAVSVGATDENFADSLFESVTDTNNAMDELQGKLLDFDKFRALSSQEDNVLAIDEKLLQAITGYSSIIDQANNKAREQAEIWLKNLGFVDENGDGIYEITAQAQELKQNIEDILMLITAIIGTKLVGWIGNVVTGIISMKNASLLLSNALMTGALFAFLKAIELFQEGEYAMSAVAAVIGIVLVGAFVALRVAQSKNITVLELLTASTIKNQAATTLAARANLKAATSFKTLGTAAGWAMVGLTAGLAILSALPEETRKTASAIMILIGVLSALAPAWAAVKIAQGGMLAPAVAAAIATGLGIGVAGVIGATQDLKYFANGGMPDKGTMFVAGEAGAEIVYNAPSGQSGVANLEQIQGAMYGALVAYGRNNGGTESTTVVEIDGERVFKATQKHAKKHGFDFARV